MSALQEAIPVVEPEGNSHISDSSTSLTITYNQEPTEVFLEKVLKLCRPIFLDALVFAEYMKGGGFNRLAAITVAAPLPTKWSFPWVRSCTSSYLGYAKAVEPRRYAFRTPRWELARNDWDISHDAAVQEHARQRLGPIVPHIIYVEPSTQNVLGQPYTIQERIPGQNLGLIWKSLTIAQKECALRIVVDLTTSMHTLTSPAAGTVAPFNGLKCAPGAQGEQLRTFQVGDLMTETWTKPWSTIAASQTTRELLCEQVDRWYEFERHYNEFVFPAWNHFKRITKSLYDQGLIPDTDRFYFCHLDLYPRNLLVEVVDDSTIKLTGLVDWDTRHAHYCPKFVAYRAPFWLWLEEDMYKCDEMLATIEPTDPDLVRLKTLFEQLASDEWKRYAFTPEYMVARRMFKPLRDGMWTNEELKEAKEIVRVWQELHYDRKLDFYYLPDIDGSSSGESDDSDGSDGGDDDDGNGGNDGEGKNEIDVVDDDIEEGQ